MKNIFKNRLAFILLTIVTIFSYSISSYSQIILNRDQRIVNSNSKISPESLKTTIEDLVLFHTRHNLSCQDNDEKGIGAAANYLENRLLKIAANNLGVVDVERTEYTVGGKNSRIPYKITLPNIIATIKGVERPNEHILILAHYDSRTQDNLDSTSFAPGANDNGSGVAALMEIAAILASNPLPVSVKLMFLSGEEHGLLGAAHMSKVALEKEWDVIAVLNNDMISNSQSSNTNNRNNTLLRVFSENIPYIENGEMTRERIFNSSENDSPSRQLARYVKEIGERYVDNLEIKLIYRNDRFGRGGDHTPFSRNGFTAVRICEYYENYDRTHRITEVKDGKEYGDVLKGVDIDYLAKNTSVNLSVVMNLAHAPSLPINVYTDVSGLSNNTKIYWEQPSKGKLPFGYYLLVRETDSPVWQKKIFVKGTQIVVPYSKDNYFFAVQSVSQEGNESLAVFSKGKR